MQEGMFSIGKIAALNRISISTLRLYDENGLLKPCYIDPETGYRYYSINFQTTRTRCWMAAMPMWR